MRAYGPSGLGSSNLPPGATFGKRSAIRGDFVFARVTENCNRVTKFRNLKNDPKSSANFNGNENVISNGEHLPIWKTFEEREKAEREAAMLEELKRIRENWKSMALSRDRRER